MGRTAQLLLLLFQHGCLGREFTFINSCSEQLWFFCKTGLYGNPCGFFPQGQTVAAGEQYQFEVAEGSESFVFYSKRRCGSGNSSAVEWNNCLEGWQVPLTLAEMHFGSDKDWYDVSLVDGYNLGMAIRPLSNAVSSSNCEAIECDFDISDDAYCSSGQYGFDLQVKDSYGDAYACRSACNRMHDYINNNYVFAGQSVPYEEQELLHIYCCMEDWWSDDCQPSMWPIDYRGNIKQTCGNSVYTWPKDDAAVKACTGQVAYQIEMCPELGGGDDSCRTAVEGEECYYNFRWAKTTGINSNPSWYPNSGDLNSSSSDYDWQMYFYKYKSSCDSPPCADNGCTWTTGTDKAGSWSYIGAADAHTDSECAIACKATANCIAFVNDPSSSGCWLSSKFASTTEADSGRTYGICPPEESQPEVVKLSSGTCSEKGCAEIESAETCKELAICTRFVKGRWAPNAGDGTPAPDKCYVKDDGTCYWNTRTSSQGGTSRRQKLCYCDSGSECNLNADAGGYTCGARINYLKQTGYSETDARNAIAGEFPSACGACAGRR